MPGVVVHREHADGDLAVHGEHTADDPPGYGAAGYIGTDDERADDGAFLVERQLLCELRRTSGALACLQLQRAGTAGCDSAVR